jgi:hypothetical protein
MIAHFSLYLSSASSAVTVFRQKSGVYIERRPILSLSSTQGFPEKENCNCFCVIGK